MRRDFILDFIALNEGTEVPKMFALWTGMSCLSAALGRRVFLDLGYITYPNLYVVLVAASGRQRKTTAIEVGEDLLRAMQPPPNLIAQKITPEALFDAMKVRDTDGVAFLKERCEAYAVAEELNMFLNKNVYEAGMGAMLVKLYDCRKTIDYRTKSRGPEELHDTCLGMLAGTTPAWLRSSLPREAIGDGLTSRIIFVYVDVRGEPIPIVQNLSEKDSLKVECIKNLQEISKLSGPMTLSPSSREMFIAEYGKFWNGSLYDDETFGGYASRRHKHLLKLSMLFSVSENSSMVIEPRHMDAGLELLETAEGNLRQVMTLVMATESGSTRNSVLALIRKESPVSRSRIMSVFSMRINSRELTDAIETLVHAKLVRAEASGVDIVYVALKEKT